MVISALVLILAKDPENNWLLFSSLIIISREILISSLREWMASMGKGDVVAVSFSGKLKTGGQMLALLFLIYEKDIFGLPSYDFGIGLLVFAAFLSVQSMATYIKSAWPTLFKENF
jgi:phosphatidylglycerophosphate synthase